MSSDVAFNPCLTVLLLPVLALDCSDVTYNRNCCCTFSYLIRVRVGVRARVRVRVRARVRVRVH